MIYKSRLY